MERNVWAYIAVMALVSTAVRVLPLSLVRRQIRNRFLNSFLYYVPYVTLAVMTFPAVVEATRTPLAGALALLVGITLAWLGAGLFPVAAACCVTVFVAELALLHV